MRTGANVALQGLNTIINPIMPDLMRFLHQRDRDKSEVAFATIWIVVVALIAPGIVVLQTFIEPFYVIWTHGKIPFNPLLFALLSMAVLVYASIQPAMAVIIGNNLIKPQLIITGTAAALVIGGIVILLPRIDILGAGIALFLAELTAGVIYVICARRWLSKRTIDWPHRTFMIVLTSVFIAAVALSGLVWFPQFMWLILVVSMILFGWNLWRFWKILPAFASQRARELAQKLPVIGKMLDVKQVL
jgi:O-antigen/teichoic acid export membrane protein